MRAYTYVPSTHQNNFGCSLAVVEACGIANALFPNMDSKGNSLSTTMKSNIANSYPMFRAKQRYSSSTTQPKGVAMSRIIGGTESPNVFPWVAALMFDNSFRCGGSLITREWVLTAAHCLLL
jgi:hypothetical protein